MLAGSFTASSAAARILVDGNQVTFKPAKLFRKPQKLPASSVLLQFFELIDAEYFVSLLGVRAPLPKRVVRRLIFR